MAQASKHTIFSDTIRLMVSEGSGIGSIDVVPTFGNDTAPVDKLYASAIMLGQMTEGLNPHDQYVGESESFTVDRVVARTMWQVDFYRDGAMEAAMSLRDWLRSESGITWCATANTDGRIRFINVYNTGSGYDVNTQIVMSHPDPTYGLEAKGTAEVSAQGGIMRVRMDHYGTGFRDIPRRIDPSNNPDQYAVLSVSPDNGTGLTMGAGGFGFSVENLGGIMIKNITEMVGANYEERACINFTTCHLYLHKDSTSGRVETIRGDLQGLDLNPNV